ncbi:MAG: hypothetical protein DRI46_01890 [Chloroflexi bacterium]|nr:MAG: hypothetical protein DRI46_01890 [Chloroflexota bacterium]
MTFRKKNKSWGSPGIEYGSNQEPYFFNTKGIGPFGLDPAGSAEFQIIPPWNFALQDHLMVEVQRAVGFSCYNAHRLNSSLRLYVDRLRNTDRGAGTAIPVFRVVLLLEE